MRGSDGLLYAYLLDGNGGGKALSWSDILKWRSGDGLLWMHLDYADETARSWLENKSGLSPLTCDSLIDEGTRPRNIISPEGLLLILRGVNCNPGEDPEDMVAVRMLFTDQRIITMRHRRLMAIADIHAAIGSGEGPCNAGDFLVLVAERIADRIGDVVTDLDDQVDELEDSVLTAKSEALRPLLADLRRKTIGLRRYIAPQRDVLMRLLHDRIAWLSEINRGHLREIAERTARFVEDIDAARERAAITQEELNNRLSEQMNKAMYTLSIVAAIFLPLGLFTGLLGINVGGIPGTDNPWAFTVVVLGMTALALGLVVLFRKIKWL